MGPDDLFNPFKYLAGEAGKVIADGWTSAMLGLWNAGLWALRLVLEHHRRPAHPGPERERARRGRVPDHVLARRGAAC